MAIRRLFAGCLLALAVLPLSWVQAAPKGAAPAANPESYQYGMKPYPKAKPGFTRLTIHLPKRNNEADIRLELLPGKTLRVDCNNHSFGGTMIERVAQGWGFNYYELSKVGPQTSTVMGCLDNKLREAFVPVSGAQQLIPYNSRLPVVIYVPKGFSVRYHVLVPQAKGTATPE